MSTIYLSGQISGLPYNEAVKKFEFAEAYLKCNGFNEVINPIKLDHSKNTNEDWLQYMQVDIAAMMTCRYIAFMPCWKYSNGARVEFQIAMMLNYNIIWL